MLVQYLEPIMGYMAMSNNGLQIAWREVGQAIKDVTSDECVLCDYRGDWERNVLSILLEHWQYVYNSPTVYNFIMRSCEAYIKKSVGRPQKGREAFVPEQLEEKNVYVKIQDAKLELYAPLLHIITAQCMDYFSYRANNHQNTILFCLDEFASFGRLDITAALRKLRKKHVRIMILTQSMADIDMIYGKDERMAMLNNFTYKVVLGCSDSDTQEYFSRLIGEQNAYRKGISKNGRQITNSKTEVRERIVPPAELARLGRKLILLTSGEYYILRKNFYFESSLWDRIIKYMKNLSREDEEDFPTENTLALDKKKEKI